MYFYNYSRYTSFYVWFADLQERLQRNRFGKQVPSDELLRMSDNSPKNQLTQVVTGARTKAPKDKNPEGQKPRDFVS